jgi:mRNA-degrading endonuclease YafQ of YafQ-DinJ toxin-antitoxin module
MKALRLAGAFKKDLKRIARRGYDRERLDLIVQALRQGHALPPSVRPTRSKDSGKDIGTATSRQTGC